MGWLGQAMMLEIGNLEIGNLKREGNGGEGGRSVLAR